MPELVVQHPGSLYAHDGARLRYNPPGAESREPSPRQPAAADLGQDRQRTTLVSSERFLVAASSSIRNTTGAAL